MKKILPGLIAFVIAVAGTLTVKAAVVEDMYYQYYLDESGNPTIFAGANDGEILITGCKTGPTECGKIYTADDVQETSPGVFEVIPGHEHNEVLLLYKD